MAVPIIPIILAVTGLLSGVSQGIQTKQNANNQSDALERQAQAKIDERAKQAKKLMQQQKTSFLKSGVYFEGTPEAIIDETYNTSIDDINTIINDTEAQKNNLNKQGNAGLLNGLVSGISSAALSFFGAQGFGNLFGGSSSGSDVLSKLTSTRLGVSMANMSNKVKGLNKGGFGYLPSSGLPSGGSSTKIA
nr:MAG TPA: hypothetical protein [Caudoviricetes sp.]